MSVISSLRILRNGNFRILSNKPIFIWVPIVSNKSLNTTLERFLNYFTSSTPTDASISNKEFSLLCAISCLQSQYKAVKTFSVLLYNRFSSSFYLYRISGSQFQILDELVGCIVFVKRYKLHNIPFPSICVKHQFPVSLQYAMFSSNIHLG